jgi:hypothetical protein
MNAAAALVVSSSSSSSPSHSSPSPSSIPTTTTQVAVLMCEVDLHMAKGDAEEALRVLDKIGGGSSSESSSSLVAASPQMFAQAQRAKAIVHLLHRRDKVAYTACFTEMVARAGDDAEAKHDALEALGQVTTPVRMVGGV